MGLELRDHYEDPNKNGGEWEPAWGEVPTEMPTDATEVVEPDQSAEKVNAMATFSHGLVSEIVFDLKHGKKQPGSKGQVGVKRKLKRDKGHSHQREAAKRKQRRSSKKK